MLSTIWMPEELWSEACRLTENGLAHSRGRTDFFDNESGGRSEKEMAAIVAELWIHGHAHYAADHMSPCGTRIVRNPPGYAGLAVNLDFNPKLVVIVGDHQHFDLFKTNKHK